MNEQAEKAQKAVEASSGLLEEKVFAAEMEVDSIWQELGVNLVGSKFRRRGVAHKKSLLLRGLEGQGPWPSLPTQVSMGGDCRRH